MTRSRALLMLGLLFSALFLWLALRGVDLGALGAAMASADPLWAAPFLLCLGAFCWLKSMRWAALMAVSRPTGAGELIQPIVIGYMGTGLMPMQLGEVVRAYLAARTLDMKMAPVLASLFAERVLDIIVLLIILGTLGISTAGLESHYRSAGTLFMAAAGAAMLMLWFYGAHTDIFLRAVAHCTRRLPPRWQAQLLGQLEAGAPGVQALSRPGRYIRLTALSIAQWSCMCACVWISLAAVGQLLSPVAALAVLATTIVAMTLPSSPGYFGALQLAYVLALKPFGVPPADAVAASFVYLGTLWVPLVLCGLLLLQRMNLRLSDLGRGVEQPAGEAQASQRH